MPRLTKSLPSYCKHRGSGQAVVTLDGKDFYLGPYGTKASKVEYDRLVSEWLQNGRRLPREEAQGITVTELVAAYWRHSKKYYVKNGRPTDEVAGIKIALRRLKDLYGRILVSEFGPISLKVVRQRMIDAGNSRAYVNQSIGRIKRAFRWGVEQELVPAAIYQALTAVAGLCRGRSEARETEPVLPVEDAIVDATIPHAPRVVADMMRVQRLSGCRPEEVCALKPRDIDQSGEAWAYIPESHKMEHVGRRRIIHFGPLAQALLAPYLSGDPEIHCFRSRRSPTGHFTTRSYRDAIHRACDQAFPPPEPLAKHDKETAKEWHQRLSDAQFQQLKVWQTKHRWNPNQLRHSAATEIRKLYGLEAAQVTLGHASANVTQVYAERDQTLAARVMQEVG